jgi:hypothetical protein
MSHVQQQILEGVKGALDAAGIVGPNLVFLDRLDPLQSNELDAILVAAAPEGEVVEPSTTAGLEQREFAVQISSVVAHATGYADRARALGYEVEMRIGASSFSVPKPGRARISASRIAISGEGDQARAAFEQTWRFTYFTRRGAPDIAY